MKDIVHSAPMLWLSSTSNQVCILLLLGCSKQNGAQLHQCASWWRSWFSCHFVLSMIWFISTRKIATKLKIAPSRSFFKGLSIDSTFSSIRGVFRKLGFLQDTRVVKSHPRLWLIREQRDWSRCTSAWATRRVGEHACKIRYGGHARSLTYAYECDVVYQETWRALKVKYMVHGRVKD
jgi:hypothetical protein